MDAGLASQDNIKWLKENGFDYKENWNTLREIMAVQRRVTVSMACKDGRTLHLRKSTRPEARLQKIYTALGIKAHPGRELKTYIKQKT
ncbi:MAG: hypothetical protein CSA18_00990 [Deltaproteobacteria bacterium]|nr:MAG: hypothetical protein CSA18_00990 [Deltaproteobacteria bacterium]